jgi:hypothetical protein
MFCRGLRSAQSQSDDAAGRSARDAVLVAKAPDSVDYDKRHIGLRVHEPPALTQASWFRAEDKEAVTVRDLIERRARDRLPAALGKPLTALDLGQTGFVLAVALDDKKPQTSRYD